MSKTLVASLAMTLLLASCATLPPPTEELEAAKLAIANAESANAQQFAPQPLLDAQNYFSAASEALNKGNETDARPLLEKAAVTADLATAQSHAAVKVNDAQARQKQVQELRAKIEEATP